MHHDFPCSEEMADFCLLNISYQEKRNNWPRKRGAHKLDNRVRQHKSARRSLLYKHEYLGCDPQNSNSHAPIARWEGRRENPQRHIGQLPSDMQQWACVKQGEKPGMTPRVVLWRICCGTHMPTLRWIHPHGGGTSGYYPTSGKDSWSDGPPPSLPDNRIAGRVGTKAKVLRAIRRVLSDQSQWSGYSLYEELIITTAAT